MKILIVAVLLLISQISIAQVKPFEVLNPQVSQGDTLVVRINPQWQGSNAGVLVDNRIYASNKSGYIYVGIRIDAEPVKYKVLLTEYGRVMLDILPAEFEVLERNFTEWFRGKPPVLTKAVQDRLGKNQKIKNKAYDLASTFEDYTTGKYVDPLDDMEVRDEFGSKRIYGVYDKKRKNISIERIVPHGGVDLRAKISTKVIAINSGRILLARYLLADGNILIIDHGSGVISIYLHLSRFLVKEGNTIKTGQIIARTGSTGGVPPHLDFRIKVHGTYVDPLKFIETVNQLK